MAGIWMGISFGFGALLFLAIALRDQDWDYLIPAIVLALASSLAFILGSYY